MLLMATFVIATCGLVYELVAGAAASYLLGDSVTQFSLVIGCYLSAMGVGSWLSKFLQGDLLLRFLQIEVAVGVLGGASALVLFCAHAYLDVLQPILLGLVFLIGALVGLEIPVLMRVLKDRVAFADLVARVLAFDYLGALAASLLFPLLLVPALGLTRTAFVFGLLNTTLALALSWLFRERLRGKLFGLRALASVATLLLAVGLVVAEQVRAHVEASIYDAPVLLRERTPYQTIALTRWRNDVRLYLDGHLQFSSKDEHRYHEALVHPAVAAVASPVRNALVLGGGDGMALRELLKYPSLEQATLVDLDPAMTRLFSQVELLAALNDHAFDDPRVTVHNADAMTWLEEQDAVYDLIVVDLPDPRNFAIGKLYTRAFYRLVRRHLAETGALVVQSTSPYAAPRAYWCIAKTIAAADYTTYPYHAYVPSFGDWGYVLALPRERPRPTTLKLDPDQLRYLDTGTLNALFDFPADQAPPDGIEVNRIGEQQLVGYHEQDWRQVDQ